MPLNKKYHPDYRKLYPGVILTPDVLSAVKKSDRKIEYVEYELKHSRVRKNKTDEIVSIKPPKEDSLERIRETGQFVGASPSSEEMFFKAEEIRGLYRCLGQLTEDERMLIYALILDEFTEREYADKFGKSQQSVNRRKHAVLKKLRCLMKKF